MVTVVELPLCRRPLLGCTETACPGLALALQLTVLGPRLLSWMLALLGPDLQSRLMLSGTTDSQFVTGGEGVGEGVRVAVGSGVTLWVCGTTPLGFELGNSEPPLWLKS